MPSAPLRACAHPGCPALVKAGRCEAHQKSHNTARFAAYDAARESSSARGYDADWYRFLDGFRRGIDIPDDDPDAAAKIVARNRCKRCGSRGPLDFDHRVPLEHGGARLDPGNIDPLCRRCHKIKTSEDQRRYGDRRGGR